MSSIEPSDFRAAWAKAAVSASLAPYVMAAEAAKTAVEAWGQSLERMTARQEPEATTVVPFERPAPRSWYRPPEPMSFAPAVFHPADVFGFAALARGEAPMSPAAESSRAEPPRNVIDFATAYSTYRTAGGHASAQLLPPLRAPRKNDEYQCVASISIGTWPFVLFMPPWMPYRR